MSQDYFDPTLFIKEHHSSAIDLGLTPFFCNMQGRPEYHPHVPSHITEIQATIADGSVRMGTPYKAYAQAQPTPEPGFGEQTELFIEATSVHYAPLIATRATAAAFGLTLIEPGQAIRILSPVQVLAHTEFEYGLFAGHRSPYQQTGYRMLGQVCTDLECHDFPHIFASTDAQLPLVISVARYWPKMNTIFFADLWLPQGFALYAPARAKAMPTDFLDLHGNRNSALACWPGITQTSLHTQTLLREDGGDFHWFWNALPTIHPSLT